MTGNAALNPVTVRKKLLIGAICVVGGCTAIAATGALVWWGSARAMCDNEVISDVVSPDGKRRVVIFQRDCGATTGFSTQVSVLATGKALPNNSGNVFVADANHDAAPSGQGGGPKVAAFWEGPQALVLEHRSSARIFKAEATVGDTHVRFVPR